MVFDFCSESHQEITITILPSRRSADGIKLSQARHKARRREVLCCLAVPGIFFFGREWHEQKRSFINVRISTRRLNALMYVRDLSDSQVNAIRTAAAELESTPRAPQRVRVGAGLVNY